MNKTIKLTFESSLELLPLVGNAVRGICSCLNLDEEQLYQLELCLVEAIVNVIKHSYNGAAGHTIELSVALSDRNVICEIVDTGVQNSVVPAPKMPNYDPSDISALPENGLGLFLI